MLLGLQVPTNLLQRALAAMNSSPRLASSIPLVLLLGVVPVQIETSALVIETPTIAMAEDVPSEAPGDPGKVAVHVAFFRSSEGWLAVGIPPKSAQWFICSNRRTAGRLESRLRSNPIPISNQRWIHEPASEQRLMFAGERSPLFAGWRGGNVFRPMVLNSSERCEDPEHWRPHENPRPLVPKIEVTLREEVKNIYDCDTKGRHIPFEFRMSDLIVNEAFVSDSGASVLTVSVRQPAGLLARCELLGPEWKSHTMAITSQGNVIHIGSGLRLVDAGDYDGDGRSEVVFQSNDYNLDGYLLAYDSFKRFAVFRWSYH
jgi:hypothetical protein